VTPLVLGLDPSLTATGYALPGAVGTIRTGTRRGVERLQYLRDIVVDMTKGIGARPGSIDLLVLEGFALGTTRQAMSYEIGGLGWVLRVALTEAGVRWIEVPPASLKVLATGRGNASKEMMLAAAIRRLGYDGHDHNIADAMWLRQFGLGWLGETIDVPKAHLRAYDKTGVAA
jgi:crossover junction endodeoxyribonuclease RuvC